MVIRDHMHAWCCLLSAAGQWSCLSEAIRGEICLFRLRSPFLLHASTNAADVRRSVRVAGLSYEFDSAATAAANTAGYSYGSGRSAAVASSSQVMACRHGWGGPCTCATRMATEKVIPCLMGGEHGDACIGLRRVSAAASFCMHAPFL